MLKVTCNTLYLGSTVFGIVLILTKSTFAADLPTSGAAANQSAPVAEQPTLIQVTSVSQLSDIKTTDWRFQTLKSLLERYRVADNVNPFLDHSSITRYEFAALLSAAIYHFDKLIAKDNADIVRAEDIATLQRLQSEFTRELATWQRRVDRLAVKTSQLTEQKFSTSTKLTGEVIFALIGAHGDEKADDSDEEVDENQVLSDRLRLNFDTSFTGEDFLRVRLKAQNSPRFDIATGTEMARLGFQGDNDNDFEIAEINYIFPVSEHAKVYITTDDNDIHLIANSTNLFSSIGLGAISRFGRYNPIYRQDFDAAVRIKYEFNNAVSLSLGYAAEDPDDSGSRIGEEPDGPIFELNLEPNDTIKLDLVYLHSDDNYGAIVQFILEPNDNTKFGLTYVRSYNNTDTGTGSELANDPFDDSNNVATNSYGLETNIRVSSHFTLAGWVGLTTAKAQDFSKQPEATIFNYAVTLAFPNLGKNNSLAGIVIGQPPKVISNDLGREYIDQDTSLHLEFFYRFQATDNLAITPGLLIVTNPEHSAEINTIYVGTVRTTFRF